MGSMNITDIKTMIKNGEGTIYYEEWARDGNLAVKCELAKHGYFPEYFLNDDTPFVTAYALKAHPEYLPDLINSTKDHQVSAVHEILIDKSDVTEGELLTHITILNDIIRNDPQDYSGFGEFDRRAEMRMKIAAEKVKPTDFEKTMTREQLYALKNIAWARGLTVREIEQWMTDYENEHPCKDADGELDLDAMHERDDWLDIYYEDSEE